MKYFAFSKKTNKFYIFSKNCKPESNNINVKYDVNLKKYDFQPLLLRGLNGNKCQLNDGTLFINGGESPSGEYLTDTFILTQEGII